MVTVPPPLPRYDNRVTSLKNFSYNNTSPLVIPALNSYSQSKEDFDVRLEWLQLTSLKGATVQNKISRGTRKLTEDSSGRVSTIFLTVLMMCMYLYFNARPYLQLKTLPRFSPVRVCPVSNVCLKKRNKFKLKPIISRRQKDSFRGLNILLH